MSNIITTDFDFEVNKGNVTGHSSYHKFGWSGVIGTSYTHVWAAPTATDLTWQTTAAQYDVVSDNTNDTSAGTGARSLYIEGLDSNFDLQSETVNMNGTTLVTTTNSYIRLNRAYVATTGTYGGANTGQLSARVTGGGAFQMYIPASVGQTQRSQYTVPAGKTAYIKRINITAESSKSVDVRLFQRLSADTVAAPFGAVRIVGQWTGVAGEIQEKIGSNHIIAEKTDLYVSAKVSTGTASVAVNYDLILVDN